MKIQTIDNFNKPSIILQWIKSVRQGDLLFFHVLVSELKNNKLSITEPDLVFLMSVSSWVNIELNVCH